MTLAGAPRAYVIDTMPMCARPSKRKRESMIGLILYCLQIVRVRSDRFNSKNMSHRALELVRINRHQMSRSKRETLPFGPVASRNTRY